MCVFSYCVAVYAQPNAGRNYNLFNGRLAPDLILNSPFLASKNKAVGMCVCAVSFDEHCYCRTCTKH